MDVALAKNVVGAKYEMLPREIVETTKKSILDTLGVMLAASTLEPACQEMVELAKESGGVEESTIIAFGGKAPSLMAAFANGSLTHALDYDDVHDEFGLHPTASCLPAALALSERIGEVDGKKFITAICMANDLTVRLGSAITQTQIEHGWMRPTVFGTFGSAAAAGKILELNENQMVTALSLASMQTAGTWENANAIGSNLRAIRDVLLAQAGVISALMAQKRLTGFSSGLEGRFGFFPVFFRGHYNRDPVLAGLGSSYGGGDISFKPWPGCRCCHNSTAATLDLVQENDIKPQDIKEIMLNIDSSTVPLCEPVEERTKPTTLIGARFSVPYIVAVAAVKRNVTLADFTPEALKQPEVLEMAEKIAWRVDPEIDGIITAIGPVIAEIKCKDGKSYSKRVDFPYGHPKKPISMKALQAKFRDCASYSVKPLTATEIDRVIELVTNLEEVPNVSQIINLLS
jgi:2-methylcitrate dehydratase PrpD